MPTRPAIFLCLRFEHRTDSAEFLSFRIQFRPHLITVNLAPMFSKNFMGVSRILGSR